MSKAKTGTKEWSQASYNIARGCSHDCLYCYARANAARFKQVLPAKWANQCLLDKPPKIPCHGQTVMFPTTHDITPLFLNASVKAIRTLLDSDNRVLIVSKPHFTCIQALAGDFQAQRDRIMFRFTIGAWDDAILKYWEPGAPAFGERLASLRLAQRMGYRTSVSIEPMLDLPRVSLLVDLLDPFVTRTIWIGVMNKIAQRMHCVTAKDWEMRSRIEAQSTSQALLPIYNELSGNPKIRWKESITTLLGLPPSQDDWD